MTIPFGTAIQDFARDLTTAGYVAVIPHYFERTGTPAAEDTPAGDAAVIQAYLRHRDVWIDTLGDGLSYTLGRDDVAADRIGLLGFSMGGHLALRLAKLNNDVKAKAIVEFFAPISQVPFNGLGADTANLPPTQIHHGEDDAIVDIAQSHELSRLLEAAGKVKDRDYELHRYPGQRHGFEGSAVALSTSRTISFFNRHTGGEVTSPGKPSPSGERE